MSFSKNVANAFLKFSNGFIFVTLNIVTYFLGIILSFLKQEFNKATLWALFCFV